jgi:NADH:ubiquinone oxidoreductase subunit 2 (subunit N)
VIVLMYMSEPGTAVGSEPRDPAWLAHAALVVPAVLTLAFGVFPQIVLGVLQKAAVLTW